MRLAAMGALVALLTGTSAIPVTMAAAAEAPAPRSEEWFWHWTDGSRDRARTLSPADLAHGIPTVTVTVRPVTSGREVMLEIRSHDRWLTVDSAVTRRDGSAILQLNPFCSNGDWCRGTYLHRLVAGGRTASFSVRLPGAP